MDGSEIDLVLLRHCRTRDNLSGLIPRRIAALDSEGRAEATQIAMYLANMGRRLGSLTCSPLARAQQTAEIIGKLIRIKPVCIDELSEMEFGEAEGIPEQEFASRFPEHFAVMKDPTNPCFHWPDGESRYEFAMRCLRALQRCVAFASSGAVACVTHWCSIGFLLATVLDGTWFRWQEYTPPSWRCIDQIRIDGSLRATYWKRTEIDTDAH